MNTRWAGAGYLHEAMPFLNLGIGVNSLGLGDDKALVYRCDEVSIHELSMIPAEAFVMCLFGRQQRDTDLC